MSKILPQNARAIVIGGGVSGCSVAYHLAKLGWKEVVLLERKQLTSGTTWHAAGLITQFRPSANMTKMAKYSKDLYSELEEMTEVATGFRQPGSISVALTDERLEELNRNASMAKVFGVKMDRVSASEVKELYPYLETSDVKGGTFLEDDGQADPANIALALAKGARMLGVEIYEHAKVLSIKQSDGRVVGVEVEYEGESNQIRVRACC